jgi:hypothetical protein
MTADPVQVDTDDPEPYMIEIMERQRREYPEIGGHCELTTLTKDTILKNRPLRRIMD